MMVWGYRGVEAFHRAGWIEIDALIIPYAEIDNLIKSGIVHYGAFSKAAVRYGICRIDELMGELKTYKDCLENVEQTLINVLMPGFNLKKVFTLGVKSQ